MKKKGGKFFDLEGLAFYVMQEWGLVPKFSDEAYIQLKAIRGPAECLSDCTDLSSFLWCSIDNDDSMDLDQVTFARREKEGKITLWVAVADVDALVPKDSPIDQHAQYNTTSVYTPAVVFPMLPDKLSTDLTSLMENENRLALVVEITIDKEGEILEGQIYRALVRNRAKLAYPSLGAWLEGKGEIPEKVKRVMGMEEAIRCQHEAAQILKCKRHRLGALSLESPEPEAKMAGASVILRLPSHNFAEQLIEHFMIAANHVMATKLRAAKIPSLRRIVRVPKRWDRIIQVALALGEHLPAEPDPKALENFLVKQKAADPVAFPDLSLTIIKLLGRGEYIVETGEEDPTGHFGLALREYVHSTAPNRRFPDLISQRQYKALLQGEQNPYALEELKMLAAHCTQQEDAATKVERHLTKAAAALSLSTHIGATFKGIVTGAGERGTWARIFNPPVEGKIVHGFHDLDVGDRVTVRLLSVDVPLGHINFARV